MRSTVWKEHQHYIRQFHGPRSSEKHTHTYGWEINSKKTAQIEKNSIEIHWVMQMKKYQLVKKWMKIIAFPVSFPLSITFFIPPSPVFLIPILIHSKSYRWLNFCALQDWNVISYFCISFKCWRVLHSSSDHHLTGDELRLLLIFSVVVFVSSWVALN